VNNDFLVRTSDKLAIRYNDRSPQENHHLAASFDLLGKDELNWMTGLTMKQKVSGPGVYLKQEQHPTFWCGRQLFCPVLDSN
jgi:hypothetical protein